MEDKQNSNSIPEYTFSRLKNANVSEIPIQDSISSNDIGAMEEATIASSNIKNNIPFFKRFCGWIVVWLPYCQWRMNGLLACQWRMDGFEAPKGASPSLKTAI